MANLYNTFDQINSSISGVNNFFDFTSSTASLTGASLTISGVNTTINGPTSLTLKDGSTTTASFQQSTTTIGGSSQTTIILDSTFVSIDGSSTVYINNGTTITASFEPSNVNIGSALSNNFGNNSATNKFGVLTEPSLFYNKINYFGSSEEYDPEYFLVNYFGTWDDYTGPVLNHYGKGNIKIFDELTEGDFINIMQPLDLQYHFDQNTNTLRIIIKKTNGDLYTATIPTTLYI